MRPHERIPLHAHSGLNDGGKIDANAMHAVVTTGGSGGSTSGSGGFDGIYDHLSTSETDTSKVAHPNGSGGVDWMAEVTPTGFLTATEGEGHGLVTNVASGAAATIDCSLGNVFDITLTANCTLSIINPPAAGVGGIIQVILRQGGSGSYTVTWPASAKWQSATGTNAGSAPTLWTAVGAEDVVILATVDGGVTWGGADESHSQYASPLTMKGDLFGRTSSADTRVPVGTDGYPLKADSTNANGVSYGALIVAAYPFHAEALCDSSGPILTSTGDEIYVVGVPN